MDTSHRKIELQSTHDLTYLRDKIRSAALSKLNLHLPAVADTSSHGPDDLRCAVEAHVEAFVSAVLAGMQSNVSVNGMDLDLDVAGGGGMLGGAGRAGEEGGEADVKEEFEAFDEKLRARLAKAVQRRDALVKEISAHRRETAARAAEEWRVRFEEEAARGVGSFEGASAGAGGEKAEIDVQVHRQDEVERSWARAVEGLARLNKGLPETRARLERAGDVVGYLGA